MAHERKTGRVMAIKGFGQLSGIPHSEYYLLNILSEKVLTSPVFNKTTVLLSVSEYQRFGILPVFNLIFYSLFLY